MPKLIDLTGKTFSRVTVIERYTGNDLKGVQWICKCECGTVKPINGKYLKNGDTRSCGCLERDTLIKRSVTHGLSRTSIYHVWKSIKQRCMNPDNRAYCDYGGRGIKLHPAWVDDCKAFIDYMGEKPTKLHTVERIDNDGNYEPGNVVWATRKEQGKNKRNNRFIEYNGIRLHLQGWADKFGIPASTIHSQLKGGTLFDEIYLRHADNC